VNQQPWLTIQIAANDCSMSRSHRAQSWNRSTNEFVGEIDAAMKFAREAEYPAPTEALERVYA
jgi:hypothetical protein